MFRCFSSWKGISVLVGAVLIGAYLVIWHQQHVAAVLPFLVILACPLMHLFMHGGHGHSHHGASRTVGDGSRQPQVPGSQPPDAGSHS